MTNKRKVLVADASKVVRASLTKQLAEHFEVREEASGESAWQTLVLDSAIVAVVSGLSLTRLDALGLIERIRASKLSRLKNVPFFLVVSSSFSEEERAHARNCGVTDFISKDASNLSLESVIASLQEFRGDATEVGSIFPDAASGVFHHASSVAADGVFEDVGVRTDVGVSDIMGQLGGLAGLEDSEKADAEASDDVYGSEDAVLAQEKLEESLAKRLPHAVEGHGVGVLAFGLDGYDALVSRYGAELAARTAQKFCYMLARKIRPEDCIGQLADGLIVIVAHSTTSAICSGFANRICKAMAAAQISVRGKRIDLTLSVGIAVVPDDGVLLSGQDLLHLAYERLELARRAGGNRVAASADYQGSGLGNCEAFVPQLKELLAAVDPAILRPCLGTVGMQLMPILKELERSFRFGLPIEEMNKRLWDRARAERMVT